ncbi:MAG: M20/M25/M40 family metallo-hydrolase [Vicinamibacterales bacterium]
MARHPFGIAMAPLASAVLLLLSAPTASAQNTAVRQYVREHQPAILREFLELVAIPNVRTDLPNIRRNADLLKRMLDARGLAGEIWDTPSTPLVFGERRSAGATKTVLFYIHFDGQAVDAKRWKQPDPFRPVLRAGSIDEGARDVTDLASLETFPDNWRVYARAAGDDKGPIQAFVSAVDALGSIPTHNIKVILHGEEEGGNVSLPAAIAAHGDRLRSDVLIILDGPQHPSGKPTIYYGARGGASVDVTVYTAKSGMHSGNYGNWLPDANVRMAQLLNTFVEPSGRIAIKGFYDDVPAFNAADRQMMATVPDNTAAMRQAYGLGSVSGAATSLQEGLNLPALSIHTLSGGEVGGVIAASSTAEIALRLVKENSPGVMAARVVEHIKAQGYFIVERDPDVATLAAHPRVAKVITRAGAASGAWRTDPATPAVAFIADALRKEWGAPPVRIRTLGGGVPAGPFIDAFDVPTVGVSLANYDDNQHADDENLRLGNLWEGIASLAAIMTR